jgi:chemotaxis protein CheC
MALSDEQLDALTEIINIGVGKAANTLNELTESHILLKVPHIEIYSLDEMDRIEERFGPENVAAVIQGFSGKYEGRAALIFPPDSALDLVTGVTGEEPEDNDLDAIQAGTLSEIGNIVINSLIGTIANLLDDHLNFALSEYTLDTVSNIFKLEQKTNPQALVLISEVQFIIEKMNINGFIILTFDIDSLETIFAMIQDKFY